MIHKNIVDRCERGKESLNALFKMFPSIPQKDEGHEERRLLLNKLSSAWSAVVCLYDEVVLRDKRLDAAHAVIQDLIDNVPEAHEYYQRTMNNGQEYVNVLQNMKDKEPRVRY